jgi:hypothetical protein
MRWTSIVPPIGLLTAAIWSSAHPVAADDWYYDEGPLAGSLRSDQPLPLYDQDPNHLWNRLFAAISIRPSELPSRPDYPAETTALDEWDRKLRNGKLSPGPVVRRIEGGDVIDLLAWPRTRHYFEAATFEGINKLLDEFLDSHGERLVTDPLKRAFFQRDLWALFDHLINQNIDRFGDADLAQRRAAVPHYSTYLLPGQHYLESPGAGARRQTLCRRLAVIIRRLAISRAALVASLPDNYAAAIRSGGFAAEDGSNPAASYLPPGLLTCPDEWVELDPWPGTIIDQREGQLTLHADSFRARSYFRVFWRFPGGRRQVAEYLDELRRRGVDWQQTAEQGFLALRAGLRQIPVGTQVALVRFMMALDDELNLVPTRVVEEVRLRIYKNVDGSADPTTNTGRGMNVYLYVTRRRLLFDDLKQGGLEREPDDLPQYRVFLQEGVAGAQDWGRYGRQQTVAQTCLHCHMFEKKSVGLYSLLGHTQGVPIQNRGLQGIAVPMGSGPVRTYPRGEREARWKLGQEDYLRLVEFARAN